jgi:hypothetical protein
MPHRGQETVIRVSRLWRWRDIPRRTRPTRVYPYCARHVSRTYRLSVVCTPRYDACATKVIVRGAHAGPRTLGHPSSGCELIHGFLELHRRRLQGTQAKQRASNSLFEQALPLSRTDDGQSVRLRNPGIADHPLLDQRSFGITHSAILMASRTSFSVHWHGASKPRW